MRQIIYQNCFPRPILLANSIIKQVFTILSWCCAILSKQASNFDNLVLKQYVWRPDILTHLILFTMSDLSIHLFGCAGS